MIATTRRMAMHDFLLVAFSVAIIVLSVAVKPDRLQIVTVRDASGNLQQYSLPADDPRLAKLKSELADWGNGRPDASLTLARWHAELAEFYVGRTQPKPDRSAVVQVAFADQPSPSASHQAEALQAQHRYWMRVRDRARQAIAQAEDKLRQRKSSSEPPPIALGDVSNATPSGKDFGIAGLAGLSVAMVFACWIHICPAVSLEADQQSPYWENECSSDDGRSRELRLSIPPHWVRIHQPAAVTLRRMLYLGLVIGVLACLCS